MTELTTPGGVIEHSDLVGGSSAAKRLACPGSYKMEKKLPATAETSSAYADEGSALHDCVAYMLDNDIVDLDEVRGMVFRDLVMTDDLIEHAVKPSMEFFDALCDESEKRGEGELQFLVEKRCQLPGIPGAFGTSDIIFRNRVRSGILDWKYGAGVPVAAIYPDDDKGDLINAQLMFYARAAMFSYPGFFPREDNKDWPVELIIFQPRVREDAAKPGVPDDTALASVYDGDHRVTYAMVDVTYLEQFRNALVRAIAEATGDSPKIEKGEHCRFAKCKAICPLWTGPVLDLSALTAKRTEYAAVDKEKPGSIEWGSFYADALELKDIVDMFFAEIAQQAHQALEAGHAVPGWKLVPKRPTEKYVDEAGAVRHAIGLGVDPDHVYAPREVKSPAQLRETLEPLMAGKTKKERTELAKADIGRFTHKISSGTTLAREDDKREGVISVTAAMAAITSKLAALDH